jgi:hypothetical protein
MNKENYSKENKLEILMKNLKKIEMIIPNETFSL